MKTLIVYQSKYGSTKQYAEWIGSDAGADVRHIDEVSDTTLATYGTVVFGSYIHIGKIVDIDFLDKNWTILQTKKVILFTVSAAPAQSKVLLNAFEKGVLAHIKPHVTWFQFQGRMIKTDTKDTVLMFFAKMLFYTKLLIRGKLPKFNPYGPFDKMDRTKIAPLVNLLKTVGC